ncbi:MAG TPA: 16S rRNA (uracil(1498)-N(3))-methyltransferase [Synechococcales bacterium UBA10510]|nr:16S rRNA (uracil(1498)-N(3))-methyltransferase [Synechococcales bacterium UBA10510]
MGRELRRLLIDPQRLELAEGELRLEAAEIHYLLRVLRLRPGDRFALVDGAGRLWTAGLVALADQLAEPLVERRGRAPAEQPLVARLEQPLARPLQWQPQPQPSLALAVAMPRRDGDVLLRMACELGIDLLLPLVAARSVAGEGLARERVAAILREACEQSERLWQPRFELPQQACKLLATPPAGIGLLAITRQADLPPLDQVLNHWQAARPGDSASSGGPVRSGDSVLLAIGPEGGWTSEEEKLALAAGWQAVSLGTTILRVSTAAVAAAALLSRWRLTC